MKRLFNTLTENEKGLTLTLAGLVIPLAAIILGSKINNNEITNNAYVAYCVETAVAFAYLVKIDYQNRRKIK